MSDFDDFIFWQSDTILHWGNENLVGEMQQFVGEMNQFVREIKQICWGNEANGWGNVLGRCPEGKVEYTPRNSGNAKILWCITSGASPLVHLLWCISSGKSSLVHHLWCITSGPSPLVHYLWCITSGASCSSGASILMHQL